VVLFLASTAPNASTGDDVLAKRISLDLRQAEASRLFPLFAAVLEAKLEHDYDTDARVDLTFDEITARTALNAFCESIGCRWSWAPGDAPPTLSFHPADGAATLLERSVRVEVVEAEANQVFELLSQLLETDLEIPPAIGEKRVSTHREAAVSDHLDTICGDLGCRWTVRPGDPPTLVVDSRPAQAFPPP
jgi:hypothetical protein